MDLDAAGIENVKHNGPEVDEAPINVDVVISPRVPTIQVPVTNGAGKVIRMRNVVDKSVNFAMPSPALRAGAYNYTPTPGGRVLITDKAGALLARFQDQDQANKHLKAAGVDATKLFNFPKKAEKKK